MRPRVGTTLLEVLVALLVSGLLLLGARALVEISASSSSRTVLAAQDADQQANGERFLRQLLQGVMVSGDSVNAVLGTASRLRFTSACPTLTGDLGQCDVVLVVDSAQGTRRLIVGLDRGLGMSDELTLARADSLMSISYLATAADGGRWVRQWREPLAVPAAIGVVRDLDTLIVPLGTR